MTWYYVVKPSPAERRRRAIRKATEPARGAWWRFWAWVWRWMRRAIPQPPPDVAADMAEAESRRAIELARRRAGIRGVREELDRLRRWRPGDHGGEG